MASRAPAQLQKSYIGGKVAARIRWGTSGDFTRCVKQARTHGMSGSKTKGFCANMHKAATGKWPNAGRNGGSKIKK